MKERQISNIKKTGDRFSCVITVQFERSCDSEELEILRRNFRSKKLTTNPDNDLAKALVDQFVLELQETGYDKGGMAGEFVVEKIDLGTKLVR